MYQIDTFTFQGREQSVRFIETVDEVTETASCDVYEFEGDSSKDLGIIRIDIGGSTPLQKVLKGDKTVEGYISGKGKLVITRLGGSAEEYCVGNNPEEEFSITVNVGDLMQWFAADDSPLIVYEVCFPPYEAGRFENLS